MATLSKGNVDHCAVVVSVGALGREGVFLAGDSTGGKSIFTGGRTVVTSEDIEADVLVGGTTGVVTTAGGVYEGATFAGVVVEV